MESQFILFITLIASFCSFGSLFPTQHLLSISDSVKITQIPSKNNNDVYYETSDEILHSENFMEGSGFSAWGENSSQLSNDSRNQGKPERLSHENNSGFGIALTTRPALRVHSSEVHNHRAHSIGGSTLSSVSSEEAPLENIHITTKEQLKRSHSSTSLNGGNNPRVSVQTSIFTFMNNPSQSDLTHPCVFGVTPCPGFNSFNGTTLLWDDMKRTLAFAWELHVYGSAGLFVLMAALAVLGMAKGCTLPHPLSDNLTLSNLLLFISGALRTTLLLLDPYGTCQFLPHAMLVALQNVPLHLLLWAQVVLTLVTLKGLKLILFPSKLQYPWLVGWLSVSHCTGLLVADLYSSALPPALPLLLQTVSLCWGIPFCLGIFTKSLSNLQSLPSSTFPQWIPSQRTGRLGKRVIAVCSFLGVLCCSLQMYSLLWLYGLLGNWRRFGWGWWLTQFWARILELAWAFSMLFLGSWIFWTPLRGHTRGDHWLGRDEVSKRVDKKSLWDKILDSMQRGSLKKSEKSWEELMPNNWVKYNLSRTGISNATYIDEPSVIKPEYNSDPVSSSSDSQTAFLWQKVGERECVLSLIEFDMRPPSPINLRRSIDNALHHSQFVAGGAFTPPPTSWTLSAGSEGDSGPTTLPPAYAGYKWMLDAESISASLDHFQTREPMQAVSATPGSDGNIGSPAAGKEGEEFQAVMHQQDWSEDDITDL
nr:proline-rich transmembrane protein 3-like [Nothobranchius furzeri]XP_054587107.1 proline-rich transmembrane protein 3-like [Nothobranchius furzeri]